LLAEFREAFFVLRPQAVHDEGVGPRRALLLRRRAALARRLAERWRPGQRQHIEIELTGLVLAPVLRGRDVGAGYQARRQDDGGKHDATGKPSHGGPPYSVRDEENLITPT
jgi:hypothetical protein